ncbi:OmpA family protein [Polycyclovorans algicola]|uniref:OmpA family protein n=1 Tax=Polycyclovorans algicola TaxID=616992 RepID=UPI00069345CA|nr:OmpA family protein [Polycyclovorans algicola]
MTKFRLTTCASALLACSVLLPGFAQAQYGDGGGGGGGGGNEAEQGAAARNVVDLLNRPLFDGSYGAVLGQYRFSQSDPVLDGGPGINALLGYRNQVYGLEAGFGYNSEDSVKLGHFIFNVLVYPFDSVQFLYGLVGVGASRYQDYPFERSPRPVEGNDGFNTANVQGGIGYVYPLRWGNYEYGLRVETLYRLSDRFTERESDNIPDIAAPDTFKDILLNVGLHMPMRGLPPPPPPPTPEPVAVVVDSDGDGVNDDRDQCPNTPRGEEVDAVGCPLPPPPPACGEVSNGGVPSLEGCGVGDSIVLRGVNFDTNEASLTVNAQTLLDDVVRDLKEFEDVEVEVGGHTDSRGAADYNQQLSERRAKSVRDYLVGNGIAENRLTTVGYGLERPIGDNETAEGQDRNRRVELRIVGGTAVRSSGGGSAAPADEPAPVDDGGLDALTDDAPASEVPEEADLPEPETTPEPTAAPASESDSSDDTDEALDDLFDF